MDVQIRYLLKHATFGAMETRGNRFNLLVLTFLLNSCGSEEKPIEKAVAPISVSRANPKDVQAEIMNFLQAAGNYFKNHQLKNGRFEYILNPDGN